MNRVPTYTDDTILDERENEAGKIDNSQDKNTVDETDNTQTTHEPPNVPNTIIDIKASSDALVEDLNNSWLNRKNQSEVIQLQGVQPTQLQFFPPGGSPYPQPGYPGQGYPQQGYSPQGQQGFLPGGFPQAGYGQPAPGYQSPPGYPPQQYDGGYDYDIEPYDPIKRNKFIAKVMLVVMVMLLLTAAFIIFAMMTPSVRSFFRRYAMIISIFACIVLFAFTCGYGLIQSFRRPPLNFLLLFMGLVCMSCLGAVVTTRYETQVAIYAALATAGVTLVCFILACTRFDFTKWYLYIIAISAGFSVLALLVLIGMLLTGHYMKPVHIVILSISLLLQIVILVMELQMILGNKTIALGTDEWVIGAFMIYTSIVSIFLDLVRLLGITGS